MPFRPLGNIAEFVLMASDSAEVNTVLPGEGRLNRILVIVSVPAGGQGSVESLGSLISDCYGTVTASFPEKTPSQIP